jgi:hypothetical protein
MDVWDGIKNFLFLRDHDHEWPSFIYIRGNLTCDGSPTITDVWDGIKNFFVSPWPWPWVTIFYIYKRKPNMWWVTHYHRCVRWKKKFFCFSMTMNMSDHLLYIYVRKPNVWWVTHYHRCVRWNKNFFDVHGRTMTMSDHLLYIYEET